RSFHVTGVQTCALPIFQWGRVMDDAEGPSTRKLQTPNITLQWGRVMDDAEGRAPPGVSSISRGFNGAASWMTRKVCGSAPSVALARKSVVEGMSSVMNG